MVKLGLVRLDLRKVAIVKVAWLAQFCKSKHNDSAASVTNGEILARLIEINRGQNVCFSNLARFPLTESIYVGPLRCLCYTLINLASLATSTLLRGCRRALALLGQGAAAAHLRPLLWDLWLFLSHGGSASVLYSTLHAATMIIKLLLLLLGTTIDDGCWSSIHFLIDLHYN